MILYALLAAVLYRAGGDRFDTKFRDAGISIISLLCLPWHWTLIPSAVLLFAALTTYWKTGIDAKWYHWLLCGLGYGLSLFPYAWATGAWLGFWQRTVVLAGMTMLVSEVYDNVEIEESARGFLVIWTLGYVIQPYNAIF